MYSSSSGPFCEHSSIFTEASVKFYIKFDKALDKALHIHIRKLKSTNCKAFKVEERFIVLIYWIYFELIISLSKFMLKAWYK